MTTTQASSWLLVALRRIRQRPGMYLRDERINSLACYVDGMLHGRAGVELSNADEESFLAAFGDWLSNRLGPKRHDCWFYLMSLYPQRTGHVEDFYRELDSYLRELGFEHGLEDIRFELSTWRRIREERAADVAEQPID